MGVPRYWREIPSRYNLIGKKCGVCGKIYFPPRSICPTCRRKSAGKMEDYKLDGKGTVESFTIIRVPPPEFEGKSPYAIALIKMDEGCYLTGQIVDCNLDDIHIGMRVEACFRRIQEDGKRGAIYYGYKFRSLKS
ncbi:MAG: Zn-ribbon domain-containing OB-fold protein [Thermoplasmata archaeon]|nr:MAG: Zn-ribbon domain-containing OB-fold protein [Thermoplasmata archaeon]KAA0012300.1 MAG: Zn-ribbon domain-containing OB-fold protein [Thermoplasmata archaeon]